MAQTRMQVALVLTVLGACGQIGKSQAFEVVSIRLSVDAASKPSKHFDNLRAVEKY